MNINEIIERDIADEERRQAAKQAAQAEALPIGCPGAGLVKWGCFAGGVLAVATMLLLIWCIVSDTPHRRNIPGVSELQRTVRGCVPAN